MDAEYVRRRLYDGAVFGALAATLLIVVDRLIANADGKTITSITLSGAAPALVLWIIGVVVRARKEVIEIGTLCGDSRAAIEHMARRKAREFFGENVRLKIVFDPGVNLRRLDDGTEVYEVTGVHVIALGRVKAPKQN